MPRGRGRASLASEGSAPWVLTLTCDRCVLGGYVVYHLAEEWKMGLDGHYFVFVALDDPSVVQPEVCDVDARALVRTSIVPVDEIASCDSAEDVISLGVPRRIVDLYRAECGDRCREAHGIANLVRDTMPRAGDGTQIDCTFWDWLACSGSINHEDPEPDWDVANECYIHHSPFDALWDRIRSEYES